MNAAEVLSKARDVLAERGWHQGDLEGEDGSVCVLAAMEVAWHGSGVPFVVLSNAVEAVIPTHLVSVWNDDPSRTYEDVILALKQAEELAVERGL